MPTFNYSDYADDLRNVICSNPIITGDISASNLDERFFHTPTFPRIRNNSAYTMDADIVRNTLEGMTGDAAVMQDRRSMYQAAVLRKLEEAYRRFELERIKKLIGSKAMLRYSIEVK